MLAPLPRLPPPHRRALEVADLPLLGAPADASIPGALWRRVPRYSAVVLHVVSLALTLSVAAHMAGAFAPM